MALRVTFISQYFYPEQFSNNSMVEELVKRGHDVDVVCCVPNYGQNRFFKGYSNKKRRIETWAGARIFRTHTIPRGSSKLQLVFNYLWFPISASWTILRKIYGRPDVSFVSMPSPLFQALPGIFLRWRKGTPCIIWVQDLWPGSVVLNLGIKNTVVRKALDAVCGWIHRQADLVLIQSEAFRPVIEAHGVASSQIAYFPNTAPPSYSNLQSDEARDVSKFIPNGKFILMFAGNIGESQDFDTLLSAALILRDKTELVWIIIGSGRDESRIRSKVKELGLSENFIFVGRHPADDMPSFFRYADAMVVSLKDNEIFQLTVPYKIQGYMACGKPILASLNGEGARIISESGGGLVAPASSPEKLAKKIISLMEMSKEERQRLGQKAKNYFLREWSQDVVYDRLERALQNMASTAKKID